MNQSTHGTVGWATFSVPSPRPSPLRALDNDEIRMTNVEGIPKSEAPMERHQALSRSFKFRDSDFFRHWSFVIRNSASVRCWALDVGYWMFFCFSVAAWRRWEISRLGILISWLTLLSMASAAEPPAIPVGLDAYRHWERWPYQRIGARAYMRSTYDRRGGNEGADASHFLYQLADDFNVTLDVEGSGILYFARYNHWHGSPWHYIVDGTDHVVKETSTADPTRPVADSVFLPENLFPSPLAWTWSITRGADLSWVPIPFEKSFRMAYSRTRYGTGYYIYHQYVRGAKLSQLIRAWDGRTPPDKDVLELIARAGTDISPPDATEAKGSLRSVGPKETRVLLTLTNAPSAIRKLTFSIPRDQAIAFGRARMRIIWDGRGEPSVDAPVALFFGAGTLYNRDGREYLVKAFPAFIRFGEERVELTFLFPMPFFNSARIELTGASSGSISDVTWAVCYEPFKDPTGQVGYFHATYRDHPQAEPGKDL